MAFSTENLDLRDSRDVETLMRLGAVVYARLRSLLEPAHNGESVAIHVDTGSYALANNSANALRILREQHPKGLVVTYLVGPDQMDQLAYRMLGSVGKTTQK